MFENVSEFTLVSGLIIIILIVATRYFIAKAKGKPIDESEQLLNLRTQMVNWMIRSEKIRTIEATGGRAAVIIEVNKLVLQFIDDAEFFTESEKFLIRSIGVDSVTEMIIQKLEEIGVIAKVQVVIPVEEPSLNITR